MKHSNQLLTGGFALIILLMLSLTFVSYQLTQKTHEQMKELVNTQYHKLNLIMNMQIHSRQRTVYLQNMLLQTDPFELDQAALDFGLAAGHYLSYRLELMALSDQTELEDIKQHDKLANRLGRLQNQIAELTLADEKEQASELLLNEAIPLAETFLQQIKTMAAKQERRTQNTLFQAQENYQETLNKILIFAGLAVTISSIIAWLIIKNMKSFNLRLKTVNSSLERKVKLRTQELEKLSGLDPLTQLYNRLKIDQALEKALLNYHQRLVPFGVLFIDIDHFKDINDRFGHDVGDSVLVELGDILRNHFRKTDSYGRWGGEEFLVICTLINQQELIQIAEKLRHSVESKCFSCKHPITISIGTTMIAENDTLNDFIKRADQALYNAKNTGRNRVTHQ